MLSFERKRTRTHTEQSNNEKKEIKIIIIIILVHISLSTWMISNCKHIHRLRIRRAFRRSFRSLGFDVCFFLLLFLFSCSRLLIKCQCTLRGFTKCFFSRFFSAAQIVFLVRVCFFRVHLNVTFNKKKFQISFYRDLFEVSFRLFISFFF